MKNEDKQTEPGPKNQESTENDSINSSKASALDLLKGTFLNPCLPMAPDDDE